MKQLILAAIMSALSATGAFALLPKIDYQAHYMEVTEVERQDTCLRVSVILKHLPGYWVSIPKNETYLVAQGDTTRKYKLLGSENMELDKRIWMKKSGQHEGVLIFEKIPADINVVDMLLSESNDNIETLILGLHLDEKDTTPPLSLINPKTLFDTTSYDKWKGLEPEIYTDIPFYQENGKAHIKGQLNNYHPVAGFSSLNIYTNNYITGSRDLQTESINPDGSFEFDLSVDYPQFSTFQIGDLMTKDIFVIPGDTVEFITTTEADFTNPSTGFRKYFGFTGPINDAIAINLLTDSLETRFGLDEILFETTRVQTKSLTDSTNNNRDKPRIDVNKVITEINNFLDQLPVSQYVKDILASVAISRLAFTGEPSDELKRLMTCNPLIISSGYRFKYNPISIKFKDSISTPEIENGFLHQLQLVYSLIGSIEVGTLHDRESLEETKQNVAELSSQITYPALNRALLSAYTEMVEDVILKENVPKKESPYIMLDVGEDKDILEELIKPYLGNLIYIDFWELGSEPCRLSMIDQKNNVEKFADNPFKVLYVSDDSNMPGSNQWLEKKNIQGEHIYLSSENWKRISEYFNFDDIPFGLLLGKDGNLIKTHFYLNGQNADKEIERHLSD